MADFPKKTPADWEKLAAKELRDKPLSSLDWRDRRVHPKAIRRTALFTIEGERDDICSPGQTFPAHDLCRSIKPMRKRHHLQPGVGHYGVFNGRRWQQQIYPLVHNLILANTV